MYVKSDLNDYNKNDTALNLYSASVVIVLNMSYRCLQKKNSIYNTLVSDYRHYSLHLYKQIYRI